MQTGIHRMNKQQGPTVEHRGLYSISCDNHKGKEYEKNLRCYGKIWTNFSAKPVQVCVTESLCCTAEINRTL